MSWQGWLEINGYINPKHNEYDKLLSLAISSYNLHKKSRKAIICDRRQFVLLWWHQNKEKFSYYKTYKRISELFYQGFDHSIIVHYLSKRKSTNQYNKNIECIRDFVES